MTAREWLALLGGHVAWSLHLMASYFLASQACTVPGGESATHWALLHATTAVAALATAASLAASLPGWRAARDAPGSAAADEVGGQRRFLQGLALPMNVLFLLGVLAAGAGNLFLPPCA